MAIVVCAIVCVFSLALLSLSYSVFAGEVGKKSSLAEREMTKSIAGMIEQKLSDASDISDLSGYIRQKIQSGTWESGERLSYHLASDSTVEELNKQMSLCRIVLYWEETGEKISNEIVEKTEEEADVNIEETEQGSEAETTDKTDEDSDEGITEETGKRLHVRIICDDGNEQYIWEDIYTLSIVDGKWVWYPEKRGALTDGEE